MKTKIVITDMYNKITDMYNKDNTTYINFEELIYVLKFSSPFFTGKAVVKEGNPYSIVVESQQRCWYGFSVTNITPEQVKTLFEVLGLKTPQETPTSIDLDIQYSGIFRLFSNFLENEPNEEELDSLGDDIIEVMNEGMWLLYGRR